MLRLPEELRHAFKEPLGPIYTDTSPLLAEVDRLGESVGSDDAVTPIDEPAVDRTATSPRLIAVGDVVTYHIRQAGRDPDVAVIDGKTEREAVDTEIRDGLADAGDERVEIENPAATLSADLLEALRDAIATPEATVIEVIGEEDLAALPAIVAAPVGSSVVYGQPGEGMVLVGVTRESTEQALDLLRQFDGDVEDAIDILTR